MHNPMKLRNPLGVLEYKIQGKKVESIHGKYQMQTTCLHLRFYKDIKEKSGEKSDLLPSKTIKNKIIYEVKGPETAKNQPFHRTPLGNQKFLFHARFLAEITKNKRESGTFLSRKRNPHLDSRLERTKQKDDRIKFIPLQIGREIEEFRFQVSFAENSRRKSLEGLGTRTPKKIKTRKVASPSRKKKRRRSVFHKRRPVEES